MSCHDNGARTDADIDSLNAVAHSWRYRDVSRLHAAALEALSLAEAADYAGGVAEATNHLAYERFHAMDFDSAMVLAQRVVVMDDAPAVERAVAHVMVMKVAQRTSRNVAFFTHRTRAEALLAKLPTRMSEHRMRRADYARSEMHIVASTYFYYVEQIERARDEMTAAEPYCQMQSDTAQWLYYNYMYGSGALVDDVDYKTVVCREFDYLFRCFTFAKSRGYLYFEANALQSLAQMWADSTRMDILREAKGEALLYLSVLFPQPAAQRMAEDAEVLFAAYGDNFQRACVLRTRGTLAASRGDYATALNLYRKALQLVGTRPVPEWIGGICEKMSVALAGQQRMAASARLRNIYLDLRYRTREDAEWESRREELSVAGRVLRLRLLATLGLAVLLTALVLLLRRWWLRRHTWQIERLQRHQQQLLEQTQASARALAEEQDTLREQQEMVALTIARDKRQNVVQRAKLSLARDIVPLLDRMLHAARHLPEDAAARSESLGYINDLAERMDQISALLTEWIQLERGRVSLNVTTFDVGELLDTLARAHYTYEQQGITLEVVPTHLSVKADRALTLFMLNTLADNARKFTPSGGTVRICAEAATDSAGDYVELSVADTGQGYDVSQPPSATGHGFGLRNCQGIIERYRKTSSLFAVCKMGVDSRVGQGSRFWFRLPRVAVAMIAALLCLPVGMWAGNVSDEAQLRQAQEAALHWADSVYYANVGGRHALALQYVDSVLDCINAQHRLLCPDDTSQLCLQPSTMPPADIDWMLRGDSIDYALLIAMRNEASIAALGTQQWELYGYNNELYTQLYKLYNIDPTIEADCVAMESAQRQGRLLVWLMLLLIAVAAVAAWLLWLRPQLALRRAVVEVRQRRFARTLAEAEQRRAREQTDVELAGDEHRRRLFEHERLYVRNQIMDNCLSTLKHETMYYPSRLRLLAGRIADAATTDEAVKLRDTMLETATYYRDVYTTLLEQAQQQAAQTGFRRTAVEITPMIDGLVRHTRAAARRRGLAVELTSPLPTIPADAPTRSLSPKGEEVRADEMLVVQLLETLVDAELDLIANENANHNYQLQLSVERMDDARFVNICLSAPDTPLTAAQCDELFAPHSGGQALLVCKQIVRELDEMNNHIGCRIVAAPTHTGHTITLSLPAEVSHN